MTPASLALVHWDEVSTLGRSTRAFVAAKAAEVGIAGAVHSDGPRGATVDYRFRTIADDGAARSLADALGPAWQVTECVQGLRCRRIARPL